MLGSANKLKTPRQISMSGAVSGSANFDGSGNVNIVTTQANIAVLTGSLDATTQQQDKSYRKTINYPQGFNYNNCIVIAHAIDNEDEHIRWGTGATFDSISYINGAMPCYVSLVESGIDIRIKNIIVSDNETNPDDVLVFPLTGTYNYKIVLLKIS